MLVTSDIKEAILKAGFKWRPYVLGSYFDTSMVIAEFKGKISHPYLQFMKGNKGTWKLATIQAYTANPVI